MHDFQLHHKKGMFLIELIVKSCGVSAVGSFIDILKHMYIWYMFLQILRSILYYMNYVPTDVCGNTDMMTSSNGKIFRVTAHCAGNSPVPGEFPAQRPVTRSFDVFFDLHPNKRLSKQWWGWWFETPPCPLRRHRNARSLYI